MPISISKFQIPHNIKYSKFQYTKDFEFRNLYLLVIWCLELGILQLYCINTHYSSSLSPTMACAILSEKNLRPASE